jgi:hypothetical protein
MHALAGFLRGTGAVQVQTPASPSSDGASARARSIVRLLGVEPKPVSGKHYTGCLWPHSERLLREDRGEWEPASAGGRAELTRFPARRRLFQPGSSVFGRGGEPPR